MRKVRVVTRVRFMGKGDGIRVRSVVVKDDVGSSMVTERASFSSAARSSSSRRWPKMVMSAACACAGVRWNVIAPLCVGARGRSDTTSWPILFNTSVTKVNWLLTPSQQSAAFPFSSSCPTSNFANDKTISHLLSVEW